jgi:urease accessory protein
VSSIASDVRDGAGPVESAGVVRAGNSRPSCLGAKCVGDERTCHETGRCSGRGDLTIATSRGRSVVARARAESPLKLLFPNNHGVAQWVFTATYGGGLVGGDAIALGVEVEAGAAALLSTQSATKVYRSPRGASQALSARVAEGALLAVIPDPVACFAAARYRQTTDVTLADGASLVLVDALTCGRAAHGERWDFADYASRTTIVRGGRTLAVDATRLRPEDGDLRGRMRRFDAVGAAFAFGPRAAPLRAAFLALAADAAAAPKGALVAASPLGDDGVVLRIAATSTAALLAALRAALAPVPALLGDDPLARKW